MHNLEKYCLEYLTFTKTFRTIETYIWWYARHNCCWSGSEKMTTHQYLCEPWIQTLEEAWSSVPQFGTQQHTTWHVSGYEGKQNTLKCESVHIASTWFELECPLSIGSSLLTKEKGMISNKWKIDLVLWTMWRNDLQRFISCEQNTEEAEHEQPGTVQ